MRSLNRMRIGVALAVTLLLALGQSARAQEAPPPERVGQIARISGAVSFSSASGGWTAAVPNYPMIAGDALYTQPTAEAAVAIDWSRIELAGGTELQVTQLDPQTANLVVPQGEVYLHLSYLAPGSTYTVTTPRGSVTFMRDGRYAIRAGDAYNPTLISVIDGEAELQGAGVLLRIGPGETATLSGEHPVVASLGPLVTDAFTDRMLAREAPPAPPMAPAMITGMTGGAILSAYGSWSEIPTYGAIWYPRVPVGWAPYREGHWAFVPPWGWTWIDDDPWGFAPFHYGRWIHHHGRWGWLPAPVGFAAPPHFRPVYAPALVSFFDIGSGIGVNIGLSGLTGGAIGWVPLAPGEPYFPWYRSSPNYIERLNRYDVRDARRFRNLDERRLFEEHHPARLMNRMAATVIGADAMRRGDPVRRFGRPAPRAALNAGRPVMPEHARTPQQRGFGRLPGAPGPRFHRPSAPAPRPAPFAESRGLPVGRVRPLHGPALRPEMRVAPRNGRSPGVLRMPGAPGAPREPRVIAPRPGQPVPGMRQPRVPREVRPSRPGQPPQQFRNRERPRPQIQHREQVRPQPRPQPRAQPQRPEQRRPQFQNRQRPQAQPRPQPRPQPRAQPQRREQRRPQFQNRQRPQAQPRPQPRAQPRSQPQRPAQRRPPVQNRQRPQAQPRPQPQHRAAPRSQPRRQQPNQNQESRGQNGA